MSQTPGGRSAGSERPTSRRAILVPGKLYFAGNSNVWVGGYAFLQLNANGGQAYPRRYLLSVAQFLDLLRQENGDNPRDPRLTINVEEVLGARESYVRAVHPDHSEPTGYYTRVLNLGAIDGRPVFTFTAGSDDYPDRLAPPEVGEQRARMAGLSHESGEDAAAAQESDSRDHASSRHRA